VKLSPELPRAARLHVGHLSAFRLSLAVVRGDAPQSPLDDLATRSAGTPSTRSRPRLNKPEITSSPVQPVARRPPEIARPLTMKISQPHRSSTKLAAVS
jgi:hypothetical protein